MGRNGFADSVDAGTDDWDFEEELRGENVVFNVGVRNVDGIGCEDSNWVDLEERGYFGDLELGVDCVAEQCVARVGVGAGLDCGF